MKILWVGDAITLTGFSFVTHNICNLLSLENDVEVFGICYNGLEKNPYNYHIYPANDGLDIYGFNRINKVIESSNPDVVVLFNDLPIVAKFVDCIKNTRVKVLPVFPINMALPDKDALFGMSMAGIKTACTYTHSAAEECSKINPSINYVPIYHGVNKNVFSRIDSARVMLNIAEDLFLVGCVATNSYRKRLDLLLEAFANFSKGKLNTKLLLHTTKPNGCYDLRLISDYFNISDKVILSEGKLDNRELAVLYSAFSVNVNTAMGEGFGLPLLEGASCGCPVVCPKDFNLESIWGDSAFYIDTKRHTFVPDTLNIGNEISIESLSSIFDILYNNKELLAAYSEKAYSRASDSLFDWTAVATKVSSCISKVNNSTVSIIV